MSDHDPEPPPDDPTAPPGELVLAEEGGVRVFYISAPTMADLVDRLALVLGEHMHDDDELHVTYNAMQNGWTDHHPPKATSSAHPNKAGPNCTSNTPPSLSYAPATNPPDPATAADDPQSTAVRVATRAVTSIRACGSPAHGSIDVDQ
jgi:hypothetical protein